MKMTNAERQKAFRARKKANCKRLDIKVPNEDFALFNKLFKASGLKKVDFFCGLLHGIQWKQTSLLNPVDLTAENVELKEKLATLSKKKHSEDKLCLENKAIYRFMDKYDGKVQVKRVDEVIFFALISRSPKHWIEKHKPEIIFSSGKIIFYHSMDGCYYELRKIGK
ncbi:MAG: hypothetical protein KAG10_10390 [Methylococcales bacterium]|nr:hypothetical protein [Methylococcales bacterium]MCK5926292.1 hypothetical protein [Methylococcales bacterium]